MAKGIFLTGTGTDIGKTYVAGLITKALAEAGNHPGYYKAAMSGNERRPDGSLLPGDAAFVKDFSGIDQSLESMCPYVYAHAWSPHLAARFEGPQIDLDVVKAGWQSVCQSYDYVTMEGSGGILCPLRWDAQKLRLEDVVRALGLPSILVAEAGLGTINSVVLTAEYMKAKGLPLKGVIFNHYHPGDPMEEDNFAMCQALTGLPILAKVRAGDTTLRMDPDALAALYEEVK